MRLAIAQMGTRAGDYEATAARMVDYSRRAADQDVDLLVFPAAALCGIGPVARPDREGFLLDMAACVAGLSEDLACPCVVPVSCEYGGVPSTEALLIANGSVTPLRLTGLLDLSEGDADGDEGPHLPVVEFGGARLGIAFTYDDLDDYDDYDYDVDVILYLSTYGFATDDPSSAMGMAVSEGRFVVDAGTTGAWLVGVGPVGCYDSQVFCGSSFVLAPWGELAAQAPSFEDALVVCDVSPSAEGPLDEPLTPEVYDVSLTTWGALTMGIHDACSRAGDGGACVVVDEDLGSMLLATLATDALGPTNVRVIALQTGSRAGDAAVRSLVSNLRIPPENVTTLDMSAEADPALMRDLAQAHLAALARGTGALPLGAADKTSLALEPFRSASAARLLPLGDLYRSDVIALAHLRNTISPVIPPEASVAYQVVDLEGIADELPSAELQVEFVDLVLSGHLEWELPLSDLVRERGHERLVAAIVGRLRDLEGLRPDRGSVIVVSSMTLAEGRGPSGLAWRDRVRPDDERFDRIVTDAFRQLRSSGGTPAAAPEAGPGRERDVHDLFGNLRDFSTGGAFSGQGPSSGRKGHGPSHGSPGQTFWENPFSEN